MRRQQQNPLQMMMEFMNSGGNPQQAMQMLMERNPNTSKVMTQIQNMAKGQNPRDFAMQLARQKGIDPKQVEDLARRMGLK
ncbi:MAG: hypothetical protein IKI95_09265 [Clostridia bacterium]|nr:hypothetical protein [Clostridia bacterium]